MLTTKFPDQPVLQVVKVAHRSRWLGDKWLYELVDPYVYEDADGISILVPSGFRHDGASVPRLAYTISGLTPDGLIRAAALVHDFLYRFKGRVEPISTRRQADALFVKIMRASGIRETQIWLAWLAVRIGGPRW